MEKNNKKPRIRFKGFTNAWEQRKLKDIVTYRRGSFPQPYGKEEWYGGTKSMPFVQVADVSDELKLNSETKQTISIVAQPMSVFIPKESVIVTLQGTIGRVAITQYDAFLDRTILYFDTYLNHDIDKYFWAITIKNKFEEERKKAPGAVIKTITKEVLSEFDIQLTTKEEQMKIGQLFKQIDNLITLHQRKCDSLIMIKKALLEKMFPKNGENYPEIRFRGFTDAWEQRKLGEIAERFDNLRIPVAANLREKGDIPYYGANGIQDYVKGYTHKGEYILVAEDGANDLKNYPVQYVNGEIWANNHVHVLQSKSINNKFLKYVISQTDIKSLLVGGGRSKLNANIMMDIIIKIPINVDEQNKIGELFYNLDNLITLHQQE